MGSEGNAIFLKILIPVITGTALGLYIHPDDFAVNLLYSSCLCLFGVLFFIHLNYQHYQFYLFRWLPGLLTNLSLLLLSFVIAAGHYPLNRKDYFSKYKTEALLVQVASEPKFSNRIYRFECAVKKGLKRERFVPLSGRLLVSIRADKTAGYKPGEFLLIPSDFDTVRGPLNPSEFNYRQYLANQGIYHQAFFSADQVRRPEIDAGWNLQRIAWTLRAKAVERFNRYMKNKDAAAIASTLILGYKATLNQEVLAAYSHTGVIHVLSVSGMHVALVMSMLLYLFWFMTGNKALRVVQSLLIIGSIWFYALLTGFSAAVCRASLMITLAIAAKLARKDNSLVNSVAASAVLLILYNPLFLADIGFQLSYLAIFGIIYLYPPICNSIQVKNRFVNKIWTYISVSLSAQLTTFPLALYYFNQFPVYFLLSNLFIILPVTLIMYAGIAFILFPFEPLSALFGWFLDKSIGFVNGGLYYLENLPFSVVHGIRFGLWYYLLIYLVILLLFLMPSGKRKVSLYAALLTVLVLVAVNAIQTIRISNRKSILFYSLSRNTAIGFFDGRSVHMVTDLRRGSKGFSYSLMPSVEAGNMTLQQCLKIGDVCCQKRFFSDGHFYQFAGRRVLLWNRDFNYKEYTRKVRVDYLLLSGNSSVTVSELLQFVQCRFLLFGGANSDYRIKKWIKEAQALKVPYYSLKHAPAFKVSIQ